MMWRGDGSCRTTPKKIVWMTVLWLTHRGRVQGGFHTAAAALGDVVDERGRTSHPGSAGDLVEWCLGCCPSEILGIETTPRHSSAAGQRYSACATGGIGCGNGAITPSSRTRLP